MLLLQLFITIPTIYFFGGFLGYILHWAFHQPWSGPLYRRHKTHHEILYPSSNFISDKYRHAGQDSSTPWFAAVLIAIMVPLLLGAWMIGLSGWCVLVAALEGVIIGVMNNWLHDSIHIRGHFLEKFRIFRVWRTAHRIHHANTRYNLGIFSFGWDRILRTYRKPHLRNS